MNQPETHIAELDGVDMPAGGRRAKLIAATAGRAVIDCFQLRPAPATKDAIEAETLEIVSATGAEPEVSAPMRGPSEGQILEWPATAEGDALVLALPERELPALVLHVRPMQGPDEGIIQAFAEGEPIGPRFDLYAPTPARQLWMNLPLGTLPAGSNEVEIRVVGKNPAASSYHVGLDYFKWAPLILHPDSVEGAWARLARNQSCGFTHQALGPAFVGGHQFWVQPCLHGGFVELAVHLPEEGDYEVETRLTTSWDYAIVQMTMDGEPLGEPVDTLTETVLQTEPLNFGVKHLAAGQHLFRFTAIDKNPESRGYLMGIDYILVKRAE